MPCFLFKLHQIVCNNFFSKWKVAAALVHLCSPLNLISKCLSLCASSVQWNRPKCTARQLQKCHEWVLLESFYVTTVPVVQLKLNTSHFSVLTAWRCSQEGCRNSQRWVMSKCACALQWSRLLLDKCYCSVNLTAWMWEHYLNIISSQGAVSPQKYRCECYTWRLLHTRSQLDSPELPFSSLSSPLNSARRPWRGLTITAPCCPFSLRVFASHERESCSHPKCLSFNK